MTHEQLQHAIRAACSIAKDTELWVFGSQAILGEHPDAPPAVRTSIEVDVQPKNRPEAVDEIDGTIGEMSAFHLTHGFYVHGLNLSAASLPSGWQERTIAVEDIIGASRCTGWCLESHDLAASKLAAYRDKDRDFVRTLLVEGLIHGDVLLLRIDALDAAADVKQRSVEWLQKTLADLS